MPKFSKTEKPNILVLNSLDARYGSTYRLRALKDLMSQDYNVKYVETEKNPFAKLLAALIGVFQNYDLLFTQKFNPITIPAVLIARVSGKPVVVDWDDFDVGLQSNVIKKGIAWICEKIGPYLATIITSHSEQILSRARKYKKKTFFLPQGFDQKIFISSPSLRDNGRNYLKIPLDRFVIGHVCTFTDGGAKNIEFILEAWAKISSPNTTFLLVGGGPLKDSIHKMIYEKKLDSKLILTGLVPHEEVPKLLNAIDVSVVWMDDTEADQARVSFKVLESLAMNIPVVGRVVGETKRLFGHLVENCKLSELPDKIVQYQNRPGQQKTSEAIKAYDWSNLRSILKETIECPLHPE